ncbi:MAG: lactate racemase domain-containing protein, partial [Caldilineaceae bacterium]|nr:lactate racemase domain-containing protein [Caldilineaceae bacterium]
MIQLAPVRQSVSEQQVDNVSAAVWNGLNAVALSERVRPGMRVAVAVGSRGISCYREVVQAVVESLQAIGADPFLVPAMGSHGGGTAEGQHAVLVGYGMADLGVPIHSSLEVKQIGETDGMPVYWDRHAAEADAVIPVNRVKAHTAFRADHESGLCKIMTIG